MTYQRKRNFWCQGQPYISCQFLWVQIPVIHHLASQEDDHAMPSLLTLNSTMISSKDLWVSPSFIPKGVFFPTILYVYILYTVYSANVHKCIIDWTLNKMNEKKRCIKAAKMRLTFHIYPLRRYFIENFEIFFGGYPHFGPLKWQRSQNEHPRTTYNPTFLLHNPTLL